MLNPKRNYIAGIIGNALDRYDMALYGLLAFFIAPNFFPSEDPMVGIIKTYGVMALSFFTRPIGSLIFGRLAMHIGAKKVMIICLSGVACTTGLLGLIPSYDSIGASATAIFILTRIVQGFFASGENTVAPFFLIKNSPLEKATRTSGFYNFSTMLGVGIASISATLVSKSQDPTFYWRYAFILGFFTAIAGLYLRSIMLETAQERIPSTTLKDILKLVDKHRISIFKVIIVSSFSYITYTIPFVFMNSFIPEVTDIEVDEMLALNTQLLVFDTCLIPVFAIVAENFNRSKFMACMSAFVAIIVIPLFYFIEDSNFFYVMMVRIIIIVAGLAYLAPLQAWYYSLFNGDERYLLVGLGYSIGEETLGRNSTAICLWLWHYFQSTIAPAIFIFFVASGATIILSLDYKNSRKKHKKVKRA